MSPLVHRPLSQAAQHQGQGRLAQDVAAKLESVTLNFTNQAGADGKLYGSVTSKEIAEALKAEFGITVDKRKIQLPEALKVFGRHTVNVKLHPEVTGKINIVITETK